MSKRDPNILLEDVAVAIEKIGLFTAGMDRQMFLGDAKTSMPSLVTSKSSAKPFASYPMISKTPILIFHGTKSEECEIGLFMSTSAWTWRSFGRDLPDLETRLRLLT